jgi:hypothetical protein
MPRRSSCPVELRREDGARARAVEIEDRRVEVAEIAPIHIGTCCVGDHLVRWHVLDRVHRQVKVRNPPGGSAKSAKL